VSRPLRIGIVNLMPEAERYAAMLLSALARAGGPEHTPVFIRLESHGYASSDAAELARYRSYADALAEGPLDGLVLTGAPVEHLDFSEVRYFDELRALLQHARTQVPTTLGLCWGGLALAHLAGIDKRAIAPKLFGLVPLDVREDTAGTHCAQSRHAGLDEASVARAVSGGHVVVRARTSAGEATWLESADGRVTMHLGHPEYVPERLAFEHERDVQRGRGDVTAPVHMHEASARTGHADHARAFFGEWLARVAEGQP
jgi:homoserine O-succinyltransferase/O-acetyltransferase